MDKEAWEKYQAKKKEIHKQFAAERRKTWFIGLAIIIPINALLVMGLIFSGRFPEAIKFLDLGFPFFIALLMVLTLFPIYVILKKCAEWYKAEADQQKLLEDSAPTSKFKFGE